MKRQGAIPEIKTKELRRMEIGIARRLCLRTIPCAAILFCALQTSFAAAPITGVVRNRTSGQPAAGDEVILLRLDRAPHEEARTRIDAQGGFTFDLPDPGHPHIVRVVHQDVNYDKPVAAAGAIDIDIFDAAAKVHGITGNIEIIRTGTRGNLLHVSDMIEIWNQSDPHVTQAGNQKFDIYLPASAMIDSVLAAGPDNVASSISTALVPGEPGHYVVNYPLLPGATKFAFNYDLSYKGQAILTTKSIYPFKQLAVMFPPTMAFVSRSSTFHALPVGSDRYHVDAAENVSAGAELEFEISGAGELPAAHQQSPGAPNTSDAAPMPQAMAPTARTSPKENAAFLAVPQSKTAARSSNGWRFVFAVAVFALTMCVFFVRQQQRLRRRTMGGIVQLRTPVTQSPRLLVDTLKDALFQLEADRLQGVICSDDYASAKSALERTIHWALTRAQYREADTTVLH